MFPSATTQNGSSHLYYNQNRWYVPGIGRYLTPDPLGFAADPFNQYAYTSNNPSSVIDHSGTMWVTGLPDFENAGEGAGFFDFYFGDHVTKTFPAMRNLRGYDAGQGIALGVGLLQSAGVAELAVGEDTCATAAETAAGGGEEAANDALVSHMNGMNICTGTDCSEIAESIQRAAGGSGSIFQVTPAAGQRLTLFEHGTVEDGFIYHDFFTNGFFAHDPRFSS